MTFRVGQKVVCVNDTPSKFTGLPTVVKKGSIYTVIATWLHRIYNHPCLLLKEVEVPDWHCGFDADRFRPIVERKTDINVFQEILRKATSPANQDA